MEILKHDHTMIRLFLAFLISLTVSVTASPATPEEIATEILAPLLDPVKVATLKGEKPANARLYKVLYWLETARRANGDVSTVMRTFPTVP